MRSYRKIAMILSFAASSLAIAAATPGHADANSPVCGMGYGKNDGLSCYYINYNQCRAAISGTSGTCVDNPYLRNALNKRIPAGR